MTIYYVLKAGHMTILTNVLKQDDYSTENRSHD